MGKRISLEAEAEEVCEANSAPPLIFQMPPRKGREVLEEAQSTPEVRYPVAIEQCYDVPRGDGRLDCLGQQKQCSRRVWWNNR